MAILLRSVLAALALAASAAAPAQDIARGETLYRTICAQCHNLGGNPGPEPVKVGANNPAAIRSALRSVPEMGSFEVLLSAADIVNLAAYLGVRFGIPPPAVTADAIEYYHQGFDHYFVTWVAAEIDNLDSGRTAGWVRTGESFRVYTSPQAGTAAVCRIYIPPGKGDGHFFGRDAGECDGTMAKNPTFILESPSFFHLFPPSAGNCGAGTVPVYRVFSNRLDANHRYTADRATRDLMVARNWLAEGDGADIVVMCAP
ncbi:MAG: cytochrome c [Burkholderiales bacterium]|nr:cytochrome c [Burkholderiales bacterium]